MAVDTHLQYQISINTT